VKELILKTLKVLFFFALAGLAVILVFGVVLSLGWPWWMGFFVLLGLIGLAIGFLFLRRIWQKRREQRFVDEIIAQDESRLKSVGGTEREQLQELQGSWKEAIDALRRSHLKKQGNPLYVLPWYLVIGESGSGKTTALQSARLSSPFAEVSRTSGISGTKNCDWWFFEQAVVIDTAGRYAIPIDEGRDKDEWQQFLTLLSKYRKKEPLNGLVVTITADKLQEASPEALEQDGVSIRRRIDELMRVLGAKSPVYVLVTKCDLVQGMTQFCDQLPEKDLDQAMGLINHDLSKDVETFIENGTRTMSERLRDLRLLLLHQSTSGGVDPALLLFPEEFERLETGLQSFITGALQENPYQETPQLRGLFFSSGRQEGSPYSHFLKALDLITAKDVLPGTNKGLFLHDFFAQILPRDRRLFAPTRRALEWNRFTKNLGLIAYVAFALAICGLLSFSFAKNLRSLNGARDQFKEPPILSGNTLEDVITMDRFQQAILNVSERNSNWWIPRLGLTESEEVEAGLKDKYRDQFRDGFLASFDEEMTAKMARFSTTTPDVVIGNHVAHLVRRINLLKARLQGERLETLQVRPQPSFGTIVAQADEAIQSDVQEMFTRLYLHNLDWSTDSSQINQELIHLQNWLKLILTEIRPDLSWLIAWVNTQETLFPLALEDFWGGSVSLQDETMVDPVFTRKGKNQLDSFVAELEAALPAPGPPMIKRQKLDFEARYARDYIKVWFEFVSGFAQGAERLKGREDWQQVATRVAAGQGPYLALLDTIVLELEPVTSEENRPPWLEPVYQFQLIKTLAAEQAPGRDLSGLAKLTKAGKKVVSKVSRAKKKLGKVSSSMPPGSELTAAKEYQKYQNALKEITPASRSAKLAQEMAFQVFSEDPATSKSPFFAAADAVEKLKAALGGGVETEVILGKLIAGPPHFLWQYVRMETACELQDRWEQEVLAEVEDMPDKQQLALGPDGYVWKFVKDEGPAAPFIKRSPQKGYYYAKKAEGLGGTIPFKDSFLTFLKEGEAGAVPRKENYTVGIRGLPAGANPGAILPHLTSLELQCGGGVQTLSVWSFPKAKTFNWSPENCGDVVLNIGISDITLSKKYTGYNAFPQFLQDFEKGKRIFFLNDFPQYKVALRTLGVKYISVTYQLSGHKKALALLKIGRAKLPMNIVTCWAQ
jgi:type VI secretion system protein ImpL